MTRGFFKLGAIYRLVWIGLSFLLLSIAYGQDSISPTAIISISQAELISLQGEQQVDLPHKLSKEAFTPSGGLVRYRVNVDLPAQPEAPLGVFLSKVSLSARLYVNGQLVGGCELGALENIRCLHRPSLFVTMPIFWHAGHNQLEFELYANDKQVNGLSTIQVGDLDFLQANRYLPQFWWQVSLVKFLMWLSLSFGVLSLLIDLVLKQDSIYFWFGLISITNAISCLNTIISEPLINIEWFSWLVFVSRFVTSALFLLLVLAFFNKASAFIKRFVVSYAVIGAVLIGITGNSLPVVMALYLPCVIGSLVLPWVMAYWTWQTRKPSQIILSCAMGLMTIASMFDWARLLGKSSFDGVYFIQYAYSGMLVVIGYLLIQFLINSLIESRELSQKLELRVAKRTADLEQAHLYLLKIEAEQSVSRERERLIRDMHDGFGSQLLTAKLMAEQGQMSSVQLSQIIDECITDLYLVIESLASELITLESALANFRYRIEQRMIGQATQLHWRFQLAGAESDLSPPEVLQILRILQEALNNIYKHASAKNIWFDFVYDSQTNSFHLRVSDDGIGLGQNSEITRGRGLNNMAQRARRIGAQFRIHNRESGSGTVVELIVFNKSYLADQTD